MIAYVAALVGTVVEPLYLTLLTEPGTELLMPADCGEPVYVCGEFVTVSVGVALLTTWPPASAPELFVKVPVPVKLATTVCVPAVSVDVAPLVAVPPLTVTGEPKLLPSTTNCTEPVAPVGVRVA